MPRLQAVHALHTEVPDINDLGKLLSLRLQLPTSQTDGVLTQLTVPTLLDRIQDFLDREVFLPLHAILCVIACSGTVQTEKTCQAVDAQFTPENFQRMAFKLLVTHGLDTLATTFSHQKHKFSVWDFNAGKPDERLAI